MTKTSLYRFNAPNSKCTQTLLFPQGNQSYLRNPITLSNMSECLKLGCAYGVTSSEAPIAVYQPGLAGTKHVSVREGGDSPPVKWLNATLAVIQKHSPLTHCE